MVAVAKRPPATFRFRCQQCPPDFEPVSAPEGSGPELTRLCQDHFDKRFAAGQAAMQKALAEEARRAG